MLDIFLFLLCIIALEVIYLLHLRIVKERKVMLLTQEKKREEFTYEYDWKTP